MAQVQKALPDLVLNLAHDNKDSAFSTSSAYPLHHNLFQYENLIPLPD
jgi:hypothetical protein